METPHPRCLLFTRYGASTSQAPYDQTLLGGTIPGIDDDIDITVEMVRVGVEELRRDDTSDEDIVRGVYLMMELESRTRAQGGIGKIFKSDNLSPTAFDESCRYQRMDDDSGVNPYDDA